jgi:hypothetical protein
MGCVADGGVGAFSCLFGEVSRSVSPGVGFHNLSHMFVRNRNGTMKRYKTRSKTLTMIFSSMLSVRSMIAQIALA